MITDKEELIKVTDILAKSNISEENCMYITSLIINTYKQLQQRETELNDCMIERNKYVSINEHLEKELQHKYDNFPKSVKNLSKEQLESLYLDLLHTTNEMSEELKEQDEVIESAINTINKMIYFGYDDNGTFYCSTTEKGPFGSRAKIILNILNKK